MHVIKEYNKVLHLLLYGIVPFSKYPWVFPLKDEKGEIIPKSLQKLGKELFCKVDKKWSGPWYRSLKSWLKNDNIKIIQHGMKENQ